MNKPDWKDAPRGAQWLAQDSNGRWYWFERRPSLAGFWWSPVGAWLGAPGEPNARWRETLEARPVEGADEGGTSNARWVRRIDRATLAVEVLLVAVLAVGAAGAVWRGLWVELIPFVSGVVFGVSVRRLRDRWRK